MSYRILMYIKRKDIPIFTFYIIAEKRANLGSHIASLKMHRTHAHRKFQKNGFAPAHRNLLPHIATRNLRSHIASHALVASSNTSRFLHSNTNLLVRILEETVYLLAFYPVGGCKEKTRKNLCIVKKGSTM